MKRNISFLVIVLISIMLFSGCKKATEDLIDCIGESLLVSVQAAADGSNSKLIHFEAKYTGDHTVSSVTWEFGDGTHETVNTQTSTHTYAAAGTYHVKAKVKITRGGATCTPEPTKSITVN